MANLIFFWQALINNIISQKNLSYFKDHLIDPDKHKELHKSLGINKSYTNRTVSSNSDINGKLKNELNSIKLENDDINSLLNKESNTENVPKKLSAELQAKFTYEYYKINDEIHTVEKYLKENKALLALNPYYKEELLGKIAHQSEILLRLKKNINKIISEAEAILAATQTAPP